MAGQTPHEQALHIIRSAREKAAKVDHLLSELGDCDQQTGLAARFRRTAKRLEHGGLNEATAERYGELTLAVHDLNLLLSQAFYS
jgi:hypothetical protein